MKPILALFLLICSPLAATADEGFFRPADFKTPALNAVLKKAAAATPKLEELTNSCGGTFISKNGHFLTALHCIERCLKQENLSTVEEGHYPSYRIVKTKRDVPLNQTCRYTKIESLNLRGPQIVALGTGFTGFDEAFLPYYDDDVRKQLVELHDDYVVLKFNFDSSRICTPLASSGDLSPTEKIYGLGYPGTNTRANGRGSDGDGLKIVTGTKTSGGIAQSAAIAKISLVKEEGVGSREKFIDVLNTFFNRPLFLLADLDIYPGLSGGPVVNSKGGLVAVVSAGVGGDPEIAKNTYYANSALTTRADYIRTQVGKALGESKAGEIFNCGGAR